MLESATYSLQPTDGLLYKTCSLKFVSETVFLTLDADISTVAELFYQFKSFTIQTPFETFICLCFSAVWTAICSKLMLS